MGRPRTPESAVTEVLVRSRRRCALCFGLSHRHEVVQGQVAHIDRDPSNNDPDNLAWLCLAHHDQYDSRTSQSRGLTEPELRHYRTDLYSFNEAARLSLTPLALYVYLSPEATAVARHLNEGSRNGHPFDPQARVEELPGLLSLSPDDIEIAIDELRDQGLVEFNGSHDRVWPTNRLFWETDALFAQWDPALDAQQVARFVVAYPHDYPDLKDIADGLGWPPRRLNPAATYLIEAGLVGDRPALGTAPYWTLSLIRTAKTRRYVRKLQTTAPVSNRGHR